MEDCEDVDFTTYFSDSDSDDEIPIAKASSSISVAKSVYFQNTKLVIFVEESVPKKGKYIPKADSTLIIKNQAKAYRGCLQLGDSVGIQRNHEGNIKL